MCFLFKRQGRTSPSANYVCPCFTLCFCFHFLYSPSYSSSQPFMVIYLKQLGLSFTVLHTRAHTHTLLGTSGSSWVWFNVSPLVSSCPSWRSHFQNYQCICRSSGMFQVPVFQRRGLPLSFYSPQLNQATVTHISQHSVAVGLLQHTPSPFKHTAASLLCSEQTVNVWWDLWAEPFDVNSPFLEGCLLFPEGAR